MAKNGEITDRALAVFVDGGAGLMAAAAGGEPSGLRNQVDQQIVAVRPDGNDRKALPKGQKRINIVHKNAGLLMCLLARTSSIKPAFLFLSFPGFREEPFLCCEKAHPGSIPSSFMKLVSCLFYLLSLLTNSIKKTCDTLSQPS
ncbi:hypothetical protein YSA_02454 [Pseudomonas putida ND6]|uniref:Uncharacterized protein n=1 Tax=Pseudomonas putida ND6 TaxID=231023 RepID=I3URH7_PSEPU|nr:hypothetical protein [Pseudomonas putida]AFK68098.1 hypothetical protein YSA_02454 [Pseudomonas putida ND6]